MRGSQVRRKYLKRYSLGKSITASVLVQDVQATGALCCEHPKVFMPGRLPLLCSVWPIDPPVHLCRLGVWLTAVGQCAKFTVELFTAHRWTLAAQCSSNH